MNAKLRPSKFRVIELPLVLLGARPMRCTHCLARQYAVVNPLVLFVLWMIRQIDRMFGLLDPEARESHLSRLKRRKKRRSGPSGHRPTSAHPPAAPAN
jgi:hypothetical protein